MVITISGLILIIALAIAIIDNCYTQYRRNILLEHVKRDNEHREKQRKFREQRDTEFRAQHDRNTVQQQRTYTHIHCEQEN